MQNGRWPQTGVTAATVVVLLASCSIGTSHKAATDEPTEVNGISLRAELNEATGEVRLPYDRFTATYEEMDLLVVASSVAASTCAREKGVVFVPPAPSSDPAYVSEQYFGPWTVDQAQRFGFVEPMTDADLVANGIIGASSDETERPAAPNGDLTDADWAVMDTCGSTPEVKKLLDARAESGPWVTPMAAVHDALLDDGRAKDLLDELDGCYRGEGLKPLAKTPWTPQGASGAISEDQIRLALQVVECKKQISFTERMAQVEASLQAPIISEYADELVAKRAQIDEAVVEAKALIAQSTSAIEPVG